MIMQTILKCASIAGALVVVGMFVWIAWLLVEQWRLGR
jgi:hypothetical protein